MNISHGANTKNFNYFISTCERIKKLLLNNLGLIFQSTKRKKMSFIKDEIISNNSCF
jgi:hypothetical protein